MKKLLNQGSTITITSYVIFSLKMIILSRGIVADAEQVSGCHQVPLNGSRNFVKRRRGVWEYKSMRSYNRLLY
ncbi:hypothetical protein ACS0TY_011943 [Phlomoides rotata]